MTTPVAEDFSFIAQRLKEIRGDKEPAKPVETTPEAKPESGKSYDPASDGFMYYGDG